MVNHSVRLDLKSALDDLLRRLVFLLVAGVERQNVPDLGALRYGVLVTIFVQCIRDQERRVQ